MTRSGGELLEVTSPDGTQIGAEVVGDGPALLLVHGSVNDRRRWAPLHGPLGEHFRIVAMDRRGRGLSRYEAGGYATAREGEDIVAVVEAIGEPVRILSHSYGATCTLAALEGGLEAERLLLYEPPFGTDDGPAMPPDVLAEIDAQLARDDPEGALVTFLSRVIRLDDTALAILRRQPVWPARVGAARVLDREARGVNAFRPGPALAPAGRRVRILLGTETTVELVRSTHAAHAALPGSDLRMLPGHAHSAMDADPVMFVAEVLDWLG